ncbi:hypothetical protein CFC21_103797 [Triticum aestivum]|uniref:Protein kinase domain-containing protein n=2 Tax=Triticum aestivum TaxID=4565 RepID=A0A3B6SJF5_WHEAT|nr:putative kinase-like protein TMKL1 [Triticum aestivum]KAF7102711.1 hypothetical protein CFC21_103797 [Triticum aestivum]
MHPTARAIAPHYLLLLFATFFFLLRSPSPVAASGDVTLLLDRLKPALQGAAPNAQLATWNASTPLCLWRGLRWSTPAGQPLRCDTAAARANLSLAGDATLLLSSIRLPAAALAGRLPPELGAFPSLESIYLAANSLSGAIPLELGNAPALSELDLAGNALSGALPPSIWNLCDRLAELRLHGNALTGAIPAPAGPNDTCDRLHLIDLGANRFSGSFPAFLTGFRGLQRLDLGGNHLAGDIPEPVATMRGLQMLNLSYNNFSGQLPPGFAGSSFTAESFLGNSPALCGPPLQQPCVSPSGLSSGSVAGMAIGLMAGAVVVASVSIGWAQARWRRNRVRRAAEEGVETEEGGEGDSEGKLVVFQGGEHLTLGEVLNATGQVVEKASYCTVYKAKLADGGGNIELRLLREGSCKDAASCGPAVRRIGRARHENLVPLRAFYQGRRGEKLLVYDYFPHRTLHDLLHGGLESRPALTWPRRHKIALGAARGLAYLHEGRHGDAPLVHGNVRSSNVLVDEYFVARVTEYAVVGRLLVPSAAEAVLSAAKADGYRAPELQTMKRCAPRTDVYAFGILLLELLMGKKPSSAANGGDDLPSLVKAAVLEETTTEVFDPEVAKGVRNPAEEGLVQALKLAMGCCAPVAAARPSMAEVVRQLEENRPKSSRSALYSPAETRSDAGTPLYS